MKECHPPIITESEFRAVQEEKKSEAILSQMMTVHVAAVENIVRRRNKNSYFNEERKCLKLIFFSWKKFLQTSE